MKKLIILALFPLALFASFPKEYYEIKNTKEMKAYFFSQILQMAKVENAKILQERQFINNIFPHLGTIDKESNEYKQFLKIKKKYKLKDAFKKEQFLEVIDIIPYSLVLAQAAIESGWGKSRFFKDANNIFGQWTWSGKGLTPANRDAGKKHKIKIFSSLQAAIRGYLINMNLGWGYKDFRKQRALMREKGEALNGVALAPTLINYSQKKEEYTQLLHKFIIQNKLLKHDI